MRSSAVFFALFLAPFFQNAWANCNLDLTSSRLFPVTPRTEKLTLSRQYQSLMSQGMLLRQKDPRLKQRQLLIPDGGLCASTCGVNMMHALLNHAGRDAADFADHHDFYLHLMINHLRTLLNKDPRDGLSLHDLATGLKWLAGVVRLDISAENLEPTAERPLTIRDLVAGEDELILVTIRSGWRKGLPGYHALVITDKSLANNVVYYSDPNHPNVGGRAHVSSHYDAANNVSVKIHVPEQPGADGYEGVVSDILRIKLLRPEDLRVPMPLLAHKALAAGLVGKWCTVSGREKPSVIFLDDIKTERKSENENFGYITSFSLFGNQWISTTPFGDLYRIDELKPVLGSQDLRKWVGLNVRLRFNPLLESHVLRRISGTAITVVGYDPRSFGGFPNGRLEILFKSPDHGGALRAGMLPVEFISGIDFAL